MRKFFVLVKKEVRELLTPQMILPLIITVVMFAAIGKVVDLQNKKTASKPFQVAVVDLDKTAASGSVIQGLSQGQTKVDTIDAYTDPAQLVKDATAKEDSAALVIPKGFEASLASLHPVSLEAYTIFHSFALTSTIGSQKLAATIAALNEIISKQLISQYTSQDPTILRSPISTTDFVSVNTEYVQASPSQVFSFVTSQTQFIPIILFIVIIFAAQMIITAMATEKENKTLEILLSAPVSRQAIVAAKMIGAAIIALATAVVYMLSLRYYMNQLTGGALSQGADANLHQALQKLGLIFTNGDYVLLGLSLFMGILCALAIAFILGAFTEDVKSVQSTITPLMVLVLLPYLITMLFDVTTLAPLQKYLIYVIPFSHPFLASQEIFFKQYSLVVAGIIYQIIVFVIFVYIASRVFSSEKLMTLKFSFGKKKLR